MMSEEYSCVNRDKQTLIERSSNPPRSRNTSISGMVLNFD